MTSSLNLLVWFFTRWFTSLWRYMLFIMSDWLVRDQWECLRKMEQHFPIKLGQPRGIALTIPYSINEEMYGNEMDVYIPNEMEWKVSVRLARSVNIDRFQRWSWIFQFQGTETDLSIWLCHNGKHPLFKCEKWIDRHDISIGQRKIWVPNRNETHNLPNTRRALYPLSCENSWRAGFFLCYTLVTCWAIHFSHFITELKIPHLKLNITPIISLKTTSKLKKLCSLLASTYPLSLL